MGAHRLAGLAVVAGLALAAPSIARADDADLIAARAALAKSDYLGARAALERALASGTNGPAELADV